MNRINALNPADRIDALNDAVQIRAGIKQTCILHPAAEQLADGGNVLGALAEIYGAARVRPGSTSPTAAFAAGLSSNEFAAVLTNVARRVILARLAEHSAHRLFCAPHELPNFLSHDFPQVDSDNVLEEITENQEPLEDLNVIAAEGLQARVRSFGKNLYISRQVIRNDDIGLIAAFLANYGSAAARLEAQLVYALLESNPVLGDQMAMFHADHGNLGTVGALSLASVSEGTAALQNMLTPSGEKAALKAAFMIVSPVHELSAKTILKSAGSESIQVIPAPWISPTGWYMTCAPAAAQTIALLHLKGSAGGVMVGKARNKIDTDGVRLGVRFDTGVVAVGRVGIFKGRIPE